MKICILGDTHFGMRGDSLEFHKYIEKFYQNIFFPYLKEHGISTIIQLGDLFDRRKFINFNSLYLCRKYFFDKLRENDITLHTLLGNHDVSFKNTLQVNSSELLLKEYDNIIVHNSFGTINFDGIDIDIVPWICDDNQDQIFAQIKSTKSQICVGHFEIAGFEMDRGNVSHDGIDRKQLSKYDIVLSGHFHHKSDDGHIFYVGSPNEMTWADYQDARGFHIFDTHTRELEFIENTYHMFYKMNYDDTIHELYSEQYKTFDYSIYEGCYVKVVVKNKANPFLFDIVLDNLYKAGAADISVIEDFTELELENDDVIDQAEDTMTILSKYIDNLSLNVENEKLKGLMRELYVEALNTEPE